MDNNSYFIFCIGEGDYIKIFNSSGNFYNNLGNIGEPRRFIDIAQINEDKYIISGGCKGINIFNYPSLTDYYCFKEENTSQYHNYAKIIKINNLIIQL